MKPRYIVLSVNIILFLLMFGSFLCADIKDVPDEEGKTITAHFTDEPIRLDGRLNEKAWANVKPVSAFFQREPVERGAPSQKTEVRILYDKNNIYVGFTCYDDNPHEIVHKELERDGDIEKDDNFTIAFDTFNNNRTAFYFCVNPNGAKLDGIVVDIYKPNEDWDGVWEAVSRISGSGWSGELAIPFKTLRFPHTKNQNWAVNFRRIIQKDYEELLWKGWGLNDGLLQVSRYGNLDGIENIRGGKQFEVKPYILGGMENVDNKPDNTFKYGIDAKYGIISNLTLDITTKTDFAQIEADREQINLTRYNLFYPEKRDFFLEGAEIFNFGVDVIESRLFYSRRIGLSPDRKLIPVLAGGKLSGKIGNYEIGVINVQTGKADSTLAVNSSVFRLKRNVFEKSYVGVMATNLYDDKHSNQGYGIEYVYKTGTFMTDKNLDVLINAASTRTPGLKNNNKRLFGKLWYRYDAMDLCSRFIHTGGNYNPEIGFVPRKGIREYRQTVRLTPRTSIPFIRKFVFRPLWIKYTTDTDNMLLSKNLKFTLLGIETISNDTADFWICEKYESHLEDYNIFGDIVIPPDKYRWWHSLFRVKTSSSRAVSLQTETEWGDYYDGKRNYFSNDVLVKVSKYFAVSADFEYNSVSFDKRESFRTREYGSKIMANFSTRLTSRAFVQWNNETNELKLNCRIHYIPRSGSDLYIVYNHLWDEERDFYTLKNAAVLKIDYLLRF